MCEMKIFPSFLMRFVEKFLSLPRKYEMTNEKILK